MLSIIRPTGTFFREEGIAREARLILEEIKKDPERIIQKLREKIKK